MKSQRVVKEIIKSEKLPQGQTNILTGRRNKNGVTSNVYTVKETILEKRIKKSYGTEGSLKKAEQILDLQPRIKFPFQIKKKINIQFINLLEQQEIIYHKVIFPEDIPKEKLRK